MTASKKRKFKFPILLKTTIIIFVFSLVIVEIAMTYYSMVMSNRNKETFAGYANNLTATVSKVVDQNDVTLLKDKVKSILDTIPANEIALSNDKDKAKITTYMAYFDILESDTDFQNAFNRIDAILLDLVDANKSFDVTCMHLTYLYSYTDVSGNTQYACVSLLHTHHDHNPGWLDPLYNHYTKVIDDPSKGFPAYFITNSDDGYVVSAGSYIEGTDNCFSCANISMTAVRAKQASSIIRLFVYMIITINLLGIIGLIIVHFMFSIPLKTITNVAKSFNNNDPKASHQNFVDMKVKSHDELNDLSEAIKTMEDGVVQRINELVEVNEALSKSEKQTARITAIANKDALTGVQSKIAYHSEVERINEKIANKENIAFGVAMIDLNYLKVTNDEFGHSAGDEALIRLASIISLTFKHSPVYRFGGDEFVTFLRGEDYDNSEKLITEFNERIIDSINNQKLPQYERISAAIGYAEYDPKVDTCVDDVFNRADQKMYQRKHEMKEEH